MRLRVAEDHPVSTSRWGWGLLAASLIAWTPQVIAAGPTLIDDRGSRVELSQPARRIVSLTPALTETVCALGACERLVATDRFSQWPTSVRALPKVGGLEDTQVERIVAARPDVVLVAVSTRVIDRLESLGLKVVALEPRTLNEVHQALKRVAHLLDREALVEPVWKSIQQQIDAATALVPKSVRGQKAYFEVASTPHAASTSSFVGELMARLGLVNIVPSQWGPFPALNAEWVVRSQPDWIFGSALDVQGMAARPGWSTLPALTLKRACGFTEPQMDTLMRAGPRLGEGALTMAQCVASAAADPRTPKASRP